MPIRENIADFIRRYRQEREMSISELAEELCIAKSALVSYLSGSGNPRADTIDFLAEKCGVSAAEMICSHPAGREQAEAAERAARIFSDLPPERRERALLLFLALVDVLSEEENT